LPTIGSELSLSGSLRQSLGRIIGVGDDDPSVGRIDSIVRGTLRVDAGDQGAGGVWLSNAYRVDLEVGHMPSDSLARFTIGGYWKR